MKAFFFADDKHHVLDTYGGGSLDNLGELEPGSYVVTAKAGLRTRPDQRYPYEQYALAFAGLMFGNKLDSATQMFPAVVGAMDAHVSMLVAATTDKPSTASFSVINAAVLPITVSSIRIAALQVDELEFLAPPEKKPDWAADLAPRFEESGLIQPAWHPIPPGGDG
jgi:hypothetical protein